MSKQLPSSSERRSFLTRLNTGLASFGAMAGVAMAQSKPASAARWEPTRHEKDDWLDKVPGKHRLVFDTTTFDALGDALLFANNFFRANRSDYGLESSDLAIVIIARHRSTPFGYNDAMWAKYGTSISARSKVEDPKTKLALKANIYNASGYGELLGNRDNTLDSLAKAGVQFAVCSVSTRGYSRAIAEAVGGNADTIFSELTANLVSNARMVPAGIVAVNRAQERGYSLVSA
jgi:intracellular sulfur oxidation DsrE/DsrF family protein